jgi:hypothetical protein
MTKRLIQFNELKDGTKLVRYKSKDWSGPKYIREAMSEAFEFPDVNVRTAIAIGIARQCEEFNFSLEDLLVFFAERVINISVERDMSWLDHEVMRIQEESSE